MENISRTNNEFKCVRETFFNKSIGDISCESNVCKTQKLSIQNIFFSSQLSKYSSKMRAEFCLNYKENKYPLKEIRPDCDVLLLS